MATVNLGRIKPVFRGAFNNSTAYVIDDIVTSGNETFIAIAATQGNATSNGSFWTKLAAKGADGTDVAATLANKEIAFKTNAGALDGIPIGTAGQFLKVNSGATGYEYATVTSKILAVHYVENSTRTNPSNAVNLTWLTFPSFTKVNANSILYIHGQVPMLGENADNLGCWLQVNTNSDPGDNQAVHKGISYIPTSTGNHGASTIYNKKVTGIGAGSCVIYVGQNNTSNSSDRPAILNPNNNDDSRLQQTASSMIIYEAEA